MRGSYLIVETVEIEPVQMGDIKPAHIKLAINRLRLTGLARDVLTNDQPGAFALPMTIS